MLKLESVAFKEKAEHWVWWYKPIIPALMKL
jgi:hypothetical protein